MVGKKSFLIKDMDPELHFELKKFALFTRVSMSSVVVEAIKDKISFKIQKEDEEDVVAEVKE